MVVDYDFCLKTNLTLKDLLIWLDLDQYFDFRYGEGDTFDRYFQIHGECIRIGCVKKDWDRWANSEEYWFDISKKKDKRAFINLVKEFRDVFN